MKAPASSRALPSNPSPYQDAKVALRQLNRRCGPLSEATPPASRSCLWSSLRLWLRRYLISAALTS
ncbi:MAG: hypothetical protein VKK63_08775 [Synechococcus sp.]|nr:hypothetical protein [Synechococcus sp.]